MYSDYDWARIAYAITPPFGSKRSKTTHASSVLSGHVLTHIM